MSFMFLQCSSLKELNISNFNTNNVTQMECMYNNCSDKLKIQTQYKNFQEKKFEDYNNDYNYDDFDDYN